MRTPSSQAPAWAAFDLRPGLACISRTAGDSSAACDCAHAVRQPARRGRHRSARHCRRSHSHAGRASHAYGACLPGHGRRKGFAGTPAVAWSVCIRVSGPLRSWRRLRELSNEDTNKQTCTMPMARCRIGCRPASGWPASQECAQPYDTAAVKRSAKPSLTGRTARLFADCGALKVWRRTFCVAATCLSMGGERELVRPRSHRLTTTHAFEAFRPRPRLSARPLR